MSNQVYCGNLNYEATRDEVRQFFEDAGLAVTHINMQIDRETGKNRSFAFVQFPTEAEANEAASKLDGASFMGRDLRVKPAERRQTPAGGPGSPSGGSPGPAGDRPQRGFGNSGWRTNSGSNAGGIGAGGSVFGRSGASDNWRTRSAVASSSTDSGSGSAGGYAQGSPSSTFETNAMSSVYLGNIPVIASDDDADAFVREVMQSQGVKIKSISKMFRPNPEQQQMQMQQQGGEERRPRPPHMYCFVEMESVEDASLAMIKCDGLEVEGGARLKCNVSRGPKERGEEGTPRARGGFRGGRGGYQQRSYGRPSEGAYEG